jgi:hypothetical protein
VEALGLRVTGTLFDDLRARTLSSKEIRFMNRGARLAQIALMLTISWAAFPQPTTRSEAGFALVGGTLIDGRKGVITRNSVVLIRGERIEVVGTQGFVRIPEGYEEVSTEGMTVLPGLWDMHTHLQYSAHTNLNAWNARYLPQMETVIMPAIASQLLMAGITSCEIR